MIAGSLVFMVAGFIFLILGRGPDPNVFQFLSIAASLVAGTLLVMGYLRERKSRPAVSGDRSGGLDGAAAAVPDGARLDQVEADLKALEDGSDEDELQTAGPASEPMVAAKAGRTAPKKPGLRGRREPPVLQPAMAGAGREGSLAINEPIRMTSSSSGGGSSSAGPDPANKSESGGGNGQQTEANESPSGGEGGLTAANRQWTSLISDVDQEKFEPPPFEKPKAKTQSTQQQPEYKGDSGKGTKNMDQPVATAPNEGTSKEPEKPRRGFFGLFKKKAAPAPAPAQPSAGVPEPAGQMAHSASTDEQPGSGGPAASAPGVSFEAAQQDVASEVEGQPGSEGSGKRPEAAPTGDAMDGVAGDAAAGAPTARTRAPAKRKTTAKKKAATKPKAAGRPKASVKAKAPGRPKASGTSKTAAKPKTSTAGRPKSPKSAAKPKTAAKRKPIG